MAHGKKGWTLPNCKDHRVLDVSSALELCSPQPVQLDTEPFWRQGEKLSIEHSLLMYNNMVQTLALLFVQGICTPDSLQPSSGLERETENKESHK